MGLTDDSYLEDVGVRGESVLRLDAVHILPTDVDHVLLAVDNPAAPVSQSSGRERFEHPGDLLGRGRLLQPVT